MFYLYQGTIGLELMEQTKTLDAILIPVSGGGMSSGIAIAAKSMKPSIKSELKLYTDYYNVYMYLLIQNLLLI